MIRKANIFWYLVFCFSLSMEALAINNNAGFPLVTNFVTDIYVAHPQNWGIIQDNRGVMYFANGDGVLVYDGSTWELVELPNKAPSRALGKDLNGIIYTASTNDLGYLQPNKFGKIEYISLLDSLKVKKIGTIREIINIDQTIYFRSEDYLIRLNNQGFSYWRAKSNFTSFFEFNKHLFAHDEKMGLYQLDADSLVLAPSGKEFVNMKIFFAKQLNNEVILANRTKGLFSYKPNLENRSRLSYIRSEANEILVRDFVYSGTITKKGEIVLGTNSGGCVIVNRNGDVLSKINSETGILQNKIHSVYVDKDENLWFALDKGISRCDFSGPITYWNERHGLNGIVQTLIQYENALYIGTLQGFYFMKDGKINQIQSGISQIWSFYNYKTPDTKKDILLIGAIEGIFVKCNGTLTKIPNSGVSYQFHLSRKNPNIIYFGSDSNLGVLKYKDGSFNLLGFIPNSGTSIRSIDDSNGDIWLSTFRDGVYRITSSNDLLAPKKIAHYTTKSGLPSLKNILIYRLNNELVFATQQGFYYYDPNSNSFRPKLSLSGIFNGKNKDIFNFIETASGDFYATQLMNLHGSIVHATQQSDGSYSYDSRTFNKIPNMMMLVALLDENKNLWVGGSEGLFKFDQSKTKSFYSNFNTIIRKVLIDQDSCIFYGSYYNEENGRRYFSAKQNESLKYRIPHKKNSITFIYSASEFNNEFELEYKYKLEGNDENWSEWTPSNLKEYTNLHEGDYEFKVVSRNIYDVKGAESSFKFSVLSPWYRTPLAYLGYIAFVLFVVFVSNRLSVRQLRNANLYLEEQVKIRTSEINQQKEELLTQSEELLAITDELERKNNELEKLSIVASKTDNAIVIMDGHGNFEWINEGFTDMYGLTFEQFIRKRGNNIFKCANSDEIRNALNRCITDKETVSYEFHYIFENGQDVWAQTTITPILDDDGEIVKLIAIDSNISNLKQAEEEIIKHKNEIEAQRDYTKLQKDLIELQNMELERHRSNLEELVKERTIELEKAKEKAEESDRLKSTFLANMSHEIRTPMNAIIGFSNFLKDPNLTQEEKEEFTQQISLNSNILLHLIDDILDISKIEAGQLKITKKLFDVNKLLADLYDVFIEKKDNQYNKEIELKLSLRESTSNISINSDQLRIQQVITNLVDNALKFTEKGMVEYGYVVESVKNTTQVKFYVKDTGIGLSEDQQINIFNRFIKVENYQKLYRGAGLGLAICKNLANLLNGEIWVESVLGKGSTFYFAVPISANEEISGKINHKKNDIEL